MKKALLPPLAVLAAVLILSLWNSHAMSASAGRWQAQLEQAGRFAQTDCWQDAEATLLISYQDWSDAQIWLHIVTEHEAVDDAEAMYRRAMAFAAAREPSELRAELADLRDQLRLLAEMERFDIKNVL